MMPLSKPALLGGVPVRPQGPPEWPVRDDDVLQALQTACLDGSWGKYQGGHVEFFTEVVRLLRENGASDIGVFGGGGGTITRDDARQMANDF